MSLAPGNPSARSWVRGLSRFSERPMAIRKRPCRHPQQYETDWMGRTYLGCPICNRWKVMKAKPAPPDPKRLAA